MSTNRTREMLEHAYNACYDVFQGLHRALGHTDDWFHHCSAERCVRNTDALRTLHGNLCEDVPG